MSEGLPVRVDAVRLAARDAQIRSVTPVAAMTRLVGLLADATGRVESDLRFTQESRRNRIDGEAGTTVQMTCQRCLQPMAVAVQATIRLALVADDDAAAALPDDIEPLESVDGSVSPLALVEDELLLALPPVALHGDGECSAAMTATGTASERSNPFAALRQLKDRQR